MATEEFVNRMVEALDIIIVDIPKEDFVKKKAKP